MMHAPRPPCAVYVSSAMPNHAKPTLLQSRDTGPTKIVKIVNVPQQVVSPMKKQTGPATFATPAVPGPRQLVSPMKKQTGPACFATPREPGKQVFFSVDTSAPAPRAPRAALAARPNWDIKTMEKMERDPRETRGVRKSTVVPRHDTSDFVSAHYHISRELGKGSFGTVTLVIDKETGMERVCKTVSLVGMDEKGVEEMRKEISLLATLDHPHVVKLFEWAEDVQKQEMVLILEYLPGGDGLGLLRKSLEQNAPLSEAIVARLMQQVLVSLQYCHSQGVLHRDIKNENFMLTASEGGELPDCKVIDFGLAVRREQQLKEICGTPGYIAPEIITGAGDFTPKADIWSVGVCALELLTGVKPFGAPEEFGGDMNGCFQMIAGFRRLEDLHPRLSSSSAWAMRSAEARDFCRLLLTPDFRARPDAAVALGHPWLQRYKAAPGALSADMLQSLAAYASLPPLTWCCLYIIAARQGTPDLEKFGKAFVAIDADGDGIISRDDLARAVSRWDSTVAVDNVMKVADLDHTGGLSFTQFVAAGLYARFAKEGSIDDLMRISFESLDTDRDGEVHVDEIRRLFRERDAPFLNTLPQDRSFGLSDWISCLQIARRPSGSGLPELGSVLEDFGVQFRSAGGIEAVGY